LALSFSFQRLKKGLPIVRVHVWIFLIAWAAAGLAAASEGILIMGDDAARDGRAGAAVASPRNASWIALNPAGIAGMERQADFELSLLYARTTLHTQGIGGVPWTGESEGEEFLPVPSMAIVWPLQTGVLGLSMYSPAGAVIHFPESRSIAGHLIRHTDRNLEYAQSRLALAYAYRFDNGWAVGISVNGSLSLARTDQVTAYLLPSRGDNEWDQSLGAGFGLGVHREWERWSVGAACQSRQWGQTFDKYRDVTPYPVDLPATVQAGAAFRIVPKLEVEIDYRFIHWNDINFFHHPNSRMGLGWHNQHAMLCGIEWQATPRWTFRAGYAHATRVMKDDRVFGSALVPNVLQDQITLGCSFAPGNRSELHLALGHWLRNHQTESGQGDFYSWVGRGTRIGMEINWMSLGYTRKF